MTQTLRLLAGAAAIAVVFGGLILLRPGSGPGIGGQPSPTLAPASASPSVSPAASTPPIACGLISNEEAATAAEFIAAGASALGVGSELVDIAALTRGDDAVITERARELVAAVQAARAKK